MCTAIYIEDNVTQLILTAESDFEKHLLDSIDCSIPIKDIMRGEFYHCQGGWARQGGGTSSVIMKISTIKQ